MSRSVQARLRLRSMWVAAAVIFLVTFLALADPSGAQDSQQDPDCAQLVDMDWTEQERWIWQMLCQHDEADLEDFAGPADPSEPDSWTSEHVLRASFLEAVLLDEPYVSRVGGRPIEIAGAWFKDPVDLRLTRLQNSAIFIRRSRFDAVVDFGGAEIGGLLGFKGSTFAADLDLTLVKISRWLFLNGGNYQRVDMSGAVVEGRIEAQDSTFADKFVLNGATVADTVILQGGTFTSVDMAFTRIGGLDASGAELTGELSLQSAKVSGSVFVTGGEFQRVDMSAAVVEGPIEAQDSTFADKFVLRGATVAGLVGLGGGTFTSIDMANGHFSTVVLTVSSIAGRVDLRLAVIKAVLELGSPQGESTGDFDLRSASVGSIEDTATAWPPVVRLNGLTYSFSSKASSSPGGDFGSRPTAWYLGWLGRQPDFSRQPYEHLEFVLREAGRESEADEIAMAQRDRRRDELQLPGGIGELVVAWLHGETVGYGFRPWRSITWIGAFLVFGFIAAWAIPPPYRHTQGVHSRLLFSVDKLLPLVTFHEPNKELNLYCDEVSPWVRRYFFIHTAAGFILAGFLVTALSQIAP